MISCWMLVGQQVLGLTLYSTYSSYFFQLAGLSDPFLGTVISNTISLVALVIIVLTVEKIGRRNIACSALTLQLVANLGIGILSVVPNNESRNRALVAIASLFSTSSSVGDVQVLIDRYRISWNWSDWLGICWRNFVSEVTSPYFWFCSCHVGCFWGHYQYRSSILDQ